MYKIPSDILRIIQLFIIWRVTTFFLTLVILSVFNADNVIKSYGKLSLFSLWANWDGGHYIGIAINGYAHIMQYAFFPLYPILIKTLNFIIPDTYISALLVSNIFLLGTLIMFYKLMLIYNFSKQTSFKAIIILLIFPSSFFLGAAYTESLVLFFTLSSLYYAKTNQWFKSSIFLGLATFTKFIAITLLLVLFLEYLKQQKVTFRNIFSKLKTTEIDPPLVYLSLFGPFGIYIYSLFLFWVTGYWFFFRDAQMHWGRSTTLLNPLTVYLDNFRQYVNTDNYGYLNLSVKSLETLSIPIFLLLLPFVYFRFGLGLTFYSLIITIFTLLSGKVDSSLRYILVAFPYFMLFAIWAEKYFLFNYFILILFGSLFGILLSLFLTGNWAG